MSTEIAARPLAREIRTVSNPIDILDTSRFEHMQRIAGVMARSNLIPESLYMTGTRDKKEILPFETVMANCFLIVNQAVRWEMDPFAVAQCTSVVKGKLCYEGKLVAAILEAKLGIELDYVWNDAAGDAYGITVTGTLPSGKTKTITGTVGDWKTSGEGSPWRTRNSQMRQLAYRGTREWARLFAPGTLLGIYTSDEMEDMREDWRASTSRDVALPEPPPVAVAAIAHQPAVQMQAAPAERTPQAYAEMRQEQAAPAGPAAAIKREDPPPPPPQDAAPPETEAKTPEPETPPAEDFPGDAAPPAQSTAEPDYNALIIEMAAEFATTHTESDLLDICDKHAERWYTNAPKSIQDRAAEVFDAHRKRVVNEQQAKRRAPMQRQESAPADGAGDPPAPPESEADQHKGDTAYWLKKGWDDRAAKIHFNKPPGWLRDKDRVDDLEAWRDGWSKHQLTEAEAKK